MRKRAGFLTRIAGLSAILCLADDGLASGETHIVSPDGLVRVAVLLG